MADTAQRTSPTVSPSLVLTHNDMTCNLFVAFVVMLLCMETISLAVLIKINIELHLEDIA